MWLPGPSPQRSTGKSGLTPVPKEVGEEAYSRTAGEWQGQGRAQSAPGSHSERTSTWHCWVLYLHPLQFSHTCPSRARLLQETQVMVAAYA